MCTKIAKTVGKSEQLTCQCKKYRITLNNSPGELFIRGGQKVGSYSRGELFEFIFSGQLLCRYMWALCFLSDDNDGLSQVDLSLKSALFTSSFI